MPIYRATIVGRKKPLLLKAEGLHEARAQLVTLDALKADELTEALVAGDSIWTPGSALPDDEATGGASAGGEQESKAD